MSRKKSMGGHQNPVMVTGAWMTPPHILEALPRFDLDPCGGPDDLPWITASEVYRLPEQDGLKLPWQGKVWMNPPYNSGVIHWMKRLADHNDGVALIFARTETEWFIETVWKRARSILFLWDRLHFHYPDGKRAPHNSGAPSCLVAYGETAHAAIYDCKLAGALVDCWECD